MSATGENTEAIALFTQTSIGPNASSVRVAAASTCSQLATSVGSTSARPPASCTSRAAASRPSRPRATSAMCAPSRANRRTAARPTPADAPVITTTSGVFIAASRNSQSARGARAHADRQPSKAAVVFLVVLVVLHRIVNFLVLIVGRAALVADPIVAADVAVAFAGAAAALLSR